MPRRRDVRRRPASQADVSGHGSQTAARETAPWSRHHTPFLSRRDPRTPAGRTRPYVAGHDSCSCLYQRQQPGPVKKSVLFTYQHVPLCKSVTLHFRVLSPGLESRGCGIFLGSGRKRTWCSRTCPVDRAGRDNLWALAPVEETRSAGPSCPSQLCPEGRGAPSQGPVPAHA